MRDTEDGVDAFLRMFADPAAVARYVEGPRRFVPALDALHRMTALLLAEHAPTDARVLVLGAGGGMELRALAELNPGWRFVGVDPAPQMLRLAERTLGPLAERVDLIEGTIDAAPTGPFDAATCLLTLHFLNPPERARTVAEIHRRLRPGAPFVAAHGSFPQNAEARSEWLDRYAAYAILSGADEEETRAARAAVEASSMMLDPETDIAILRDGGFRNAALFFAAFTWRGWVGRA